MTTAVLTRTEADSQRLSSLLQGSGIASVVWPLISISPIPDEEQVAVPELAAGGCCIFISANAVRFGLPQLAAGLDQTPAIKVLAVGRKTQETLAASGIEAIAPEQPDSEGLLALPMLSGSVIPDTVIVKGEGGRELLATELRRRGGQVKEWSCYRRCWPQADPGLLNRLGGPLVFQASSGEILQRLSQLLAGSEKQYLLQSPVIVPSDRVARLAEDLGWDRVIRAQDASDQGFLNAIKPMLSVDGNR